MFKYIFISGSKSENTFFKLKSKVTGKNKLSISIVFKFDISYRSAFNVTLSNLSLYQISFATKLSKDLKIEKINQDY